MQNIFTTIGIWIGALCSLAIFSFLYKDNPFYKAAEQIFVGLSAGYIFIYTIFNILIPNLFMPLKTDFGANIILLVPALLGILMLSQLYPKWSWLSKFPISMMIGTTAGISMMRLLQSDVINQVTATMLNPFAADNWIGVTGEILLIIGTVSSIIYFYFSKKHEGIYGKTAKLGIYFLMVSFGAAFGYTAMGRISLLIGRLQFLLGDWLHIIE